MLTVNSTAARVSAAAGVVLKKSPAGRLEEGALRNAVVLDKDQFFREGSLEELWGIRTTETVGEDGTVTRTVSGSVDLIGPESRGRAAFSVTTALNAADYQVGDLSEAADALSAIHAARKSVWESGGSVQLELKLPKDLEVIYDKQKEEAAGSFADMVSGGQADEREKVYQSVRAVFASFDAKYLSLTAQLGPERWLRGSWMESVLSLRRLGAAARPEAGGAAGLYSLQELELSARRLCGGFERRG